MRRYDLFLFVGEPSGDLHGQALIQELYALHPNLRILAVAGPKMREHPITTLIPMEEFQVMGFVDVFLALKKLYGHFKTITKTILKENPKAVVCIDYPGFSLRLERSLRKKGYTGKIIHYICPSVWAHGKGRIGLMERNLDLLLSIFPFEKKMFCKEFPVHYIGHPLVHRIHSYSHKPLLEADNRRIVSIFPGSRKKEVLLNLPLHLEAAKALLILDPQIRIAISVTAKTLLPLIQNICQEKGLENILFVPQEDAYNLMHSSTLALAKSGTVTLELALHEVPTVVTYKASPLDLFIAKNILRILLPFYCIVNIIADKKIFPELIGPYARKDLLIKEASSILQSHQQQENIRQGCRDVKKILGSGFASREAANQILLCAKIG